MLRVALTSTRLQSRLLRLHSHGEPFAEVPAREPAPYSLGWLTLEGRWRGGGLEFELNINRIAVVALRGRRPK